MIRLTLLLIFLFSCSDDIMNDESIAWIKDLSISRNSTELYIQAELSELLTDGMLSSISIDLEYIGDDTLEYKESFILYDDGLTGGDIIANNGIYTLVTSSEDLVMPDEPLEINNLSFPEFKSLKQSESDSIEFAIRIKGNQYNANVSLVEAPAGPTYTHSENININNTKLEILIDNSLLMVDSLDTEICDRWLKYELASQPNQLPYDYSEPVIDINNMNYLKYESMFQVGSMDDCASTGSATFIFRLTNLDDDESIDSTRTIIIYGCGDNICTPDYETDSSCPGDCP